jgi:hypothetical protein
MWRSARPNEGALLHSRLSVSGTHDDVRSSQRDDPGPHKWGKEVQTRLQRCTLLEYTQFNSMASNDNWVSKKIQGAVAGAGNAVGGVFTTIGNGISGVGRGYGNAVSGTTRGWADGVRK